MQFQNREEAIDAIVDDSIDGIVHRCLKNAMVRVPEPGNIWEWIGVCDDCGAFPAILYVDHGAFCCKPCCHD